MKNLILLISMLLISNAAHAACNKSDAKGTWHIYSILGGLPARCTLKVSNSGNNLVGGSICESPGDIVLPLSGNLSLAKNCHVTGTVTISTIGARQIDAWVSKGKDSISGGGFNPNNVSDAFIFSGVK